MSRVGPSTFSTLSMNERVIFWSSARSSSPAGTVDAALRAAERHPGDRGLPGHQGGQRADLVEVDLGVVADAALVRAPGAVVLDAVARVDVDLAVRELDRDLHLDLPVGGPEHDPQVVGEPQAVGRRSRSSGGRCRGSRPRPAAPASLRRRPPPRPRPPRPPAATCRAAPARLQASRSPSSPSQPPKSAPYQVILAQACSGGEALNPRCERRHVRPPCTLAAGLECPHGAIAQLGERVVCIHEVAGSSPAGSIWICGAPCLPETV